MSGSVHRYSDLGEEGSSLPDEGAAKGQSLQQFWTAKTGYKQVSIIMYCDALSTATLEIKPSIK